MEKARARTIELTLDTRQRAKDPDLTLPSAGVNQPEVAPLTFGPNRFTVRVPSHATKLNLGEGDKTDAIRFNKRLGVGTESGIVAQTDQHTHLHTFGTELPEAKTLVRLGIPPTSVPSTGPTYTPNAETGIGCLLPDSYSKWNGYSMVTQGASYQESRNDYVVVSAEGEARVIASKLISLASSGDVIIGADTAVTPQYIAANQHDPADPVDVGNADLEYRQAKQGRLAVKSLELVNTYVSAIQSFISGIEHKPLPAMTGWAPLGFPEKVAEAAEVAECIAATAALVAGIAMPSSPGGRVGLYGSSSANVSAEGTVAINAGTIGSMAAGVMTYIVGGLFASVTGLLSASLTGVFAKVAGTYAATLQSLFGDAEVRSPVGVSVYSQLGPVKVTGNTVVQLNSVAGSASVHGMLETFIGAGPGPGMGLLALPAAMQLGVFAAPGNFLAPVPVITTGMTFLPAAIIASMSPTELNLTPAAAVLTAPVITAMGSGSVTVMSPIVTVTGGMVYLG
jgi:hypothetical protein